MGRQLQHSIKCLHPKCDRAGTSHGLCHSHAEAYRKRVRLGETTWAALEAAGLALPAKPKHRYWPACQ